MCIYMESVKHKHCYGGWFARHNGKLYLYCVASCFAVCGASKVAIVTILCGGKCQTKCILTQMPLLKMTPEPITQPFPIQGLCTVVQSPATERETV